MNEGSTAITDQEKLKCYFQDTILPNACKLQSWDKKSTDDYIPDDIQEDLNPCDTFAEKLLHCIENESQVSKIS